MTIVEGNKKPWESYYGPNLGYVQEQYELFSEDPGAVTPAYRELFEQWGAPPMPGRDAHTTTFSGNAQNNSGSVDIQLLQKAVTAGKLVWNIRTYGHLAADIDPLGISEEADTSLLEPKNFELNEEDLKALPASLIWEGADGQTANGWDAIQRLRQIYTGQSRMSSATYTKCKNVNGSIVVRNLALPRHHLIRKNALLYWSVWSKWSNSKISCIKLLWDKSASLLKETMCLCQCWMKLCGLCRIRAQAIS